MCQNSIYPAYSNHATNMNLAHKLTLTHPGLIINITQTYRKGNGMAIYLEPCKDTLVHFACPTCNNPVDVLTAKAITCNREIICNTCCTHSLDDDYECDNDDCACNNPYDIVTAAVILRPHAKTLMDNPKSILDTTWYHVTDTPPEMMVFDGTCNMHVGQREQQ